MSIGDVLAAARRQAGLTIADVSERTRIRETIIRQIERDDFSGCGGDFYARGHIRAIAHAVGTEPEPLVKEYDSSRGTPEAGRGGREADSSLPWPGASFRYREPRGPNWSMALAVLLAVVVGLVIYHLVTAHPASDTAVGHKPAAAHSARKHPAATKTPGPSAATPGPASLVISLTAVTEPCWVDLTTASGAPIFQAILNPGISETWTERQAVTLQLGNPGAITLTIDGKSRTGLGSNPVTLSLGPGQPASG